MCVLHNNYKILTTPPTTHGSEGPSLLGGGNLQTDAAKLYPFVPIPAKEKKLGLLSIYKFSLLLIIQHKTTTFYFSRFVTVTISVEIRLYNSRFLLSRRLLPTREHNLHNQPLIFYPQFLPLRLQFTDYSSYRRLLFPIEQCIPRRRL